MKVAGCSGRVTICRSVALMCVSLAVVLLSVAKTRAQNGSIFVTTTPSGAGVWLDNVYAGQTTPATLTDIAPGSHFIDVILAGYEWQGTGTGVTDGGQTTVDLKLRPFWHEAVDLGSGWKWSGWLGYFAEFGNGWIYHLQHSFMYCTGPSTDSVLFWTSDMGWLWSSAGIYPNIYRFQDGAWLWYQLGSSPRWFYNYTSAQWEMR